MRELLCIYRPARYGPDEVYDGTLQGLGLDAELTENISMIWVVMGTGALARIPGVLEQVYAADASASPRFAPPLVGETNSLIVLQTLADEPARDNAGKKRQQIATVVVVVLKLKATSA
jgi:hypothetical protein